MMLDNTGLTQDDVQSIQEALRLFSKVSEAVLYGSRAKGNNRPGSDIDLTLRGDDL
jgi:predicted nucleotidyltransferase